MKIKKIIPTLIMLLMACGCFFLGNAYNKVVQAKKTEGPAVRTQVEKRAVKSSPSSTVARKSTQKFLEQQILVKKSVGAVSKVPGLKTPVAKQARVAEKAAVEKTKTSESAVSKTRKTMRTAAAVAPEKDAFNFYKIRKSPKDKVVDHNSLYEPGDRPFDVDTSDMSEFSD
ncbi:MAG TPA: hypothetical protein VNJ01_17360 [Bacteriovoracaceae bacterium]|nr:hypothetical protein [Bacteriovoracaceae bacterium]